MLSIIVTTLKCLTAAMFLAVALHAAAPANALLGRWDLTLTTPAGERPSWIEVSGAPGHTTLIMVGIVDHATPLTRFQIQGSSIEFVSPKDEEGFRHDTLFKGRLIGHHLVGTAADTAGDRWHWTGVRAPTLLRPAPPEWSAPMKLFNGKDLTGWHLSTPVQPLTWKVDEGSLLKAGRGSDLVTNSKLEDFKLHVEFKCSPSANSGIYLRGRYELQIETDSAAEPASHHTGGIYGFIKPSPEQPRRPDVWQTMDVTLVGRTLTVVQNGITVIDRKQIPGITGGAIDSHEALPGPIAIQGTEPGTIAFRNIIVTPAKRSMP